MSREAWISRPTLGPRCKFRIFKDRKGNWQPWILVHPASPTVDSKRHATRYQTWKGAFDVAMTLQDIRNRGDLTP